MLPLTRRGLGTSTFRCLHDGTGHWAQAKLLISVPGIVCSVLSAQRPAPDASSLPSLGLWASVEAFPIFSRMEKPRELRATIRVSVSFQPACSPSCSTGLGSLTSDGGTSPIWLLGTTEVALTPSSVRGLSEYPEEYLPFNQDCYYEYSTYST